MATQAEITALAVQLGWSEHFQEKLDYHFPWLQSLYSQASNMLSQEEVHRLGLEEHRRALLARIQQGGL
jgi:hypothetical protein